MASIKEQAAEKRRQAQAEADRLQARAAAARQAGNRDFVIDGSAINCMEDLQKELYAQGLGQDPQGSWHMTPDQIFRFLDEAPFTFTFLHNDFQFLDGSFGLREAKLPGGFVADLIAKIHQQERGL